MMTIERCTWRFKCNCAENFTTGTGDKQAWATLFDKDMLGLSEQQELSARLAWKTRTKRREGQSQCYNNITTISQDSSFSWVEVCCLTTLSVSAAIGWQVLWWLSASVAQVMSILMWLWHHSQYNSPSPDELYRMEPDVLLGHYYLDTYLTHTDIKKWCVQSSSLST